MIETIQGMALPAATLTMGIGAGVYLLYAVVIMPGLKKTDDRTFVGAFQQIDTAIVGPFLLVFFIGPLVFNLIAALDRLGDGTSTASTLIYTSVVLQAVIFGITFVVNVPLNDEIKAEGDPDRIADLGAVRARFNEPRWTRWNWVRTTAATIAFGCLTWATAIEGVL